MEPDEELLELRKVKEELLQKARTVRDTWAAKHDSQPKYKTINVDLTDAPLEKTESYEERHAARLVEVAQNVTGIAFRNPDRKLQKDNTWLYTATVVMKVLKFKLELTIDEKTTSNEVVDINCHFILVDASIIQEIKDWVSLFTRARNFSCLISAFSEYNELSLIRNKILAKLNMDKFCSLAKNADEGGGIIIHLHSPKATKTTLATFLWQIKFNEKYYSHLHTFNIDDLDDGFADKYKDLLQDFCKFGLKTEELTRLWEDLSVAIEEYVD